MKSKEKMELGWTRAQKGEEWGLHGGDGEVTWKEEKIGTTENHIEKNGGKRIQQATEVDQLGESLGRSARQA